jgi:hypothetical protein
MAFRTPHLTGNPVPGSPEHTDVAASDTRAYINGVLWHLAEAKHNRELYVNMAVEILSYYGRLWPDKSKYLWKPTAGLPSGVFACKADVMAMRSREGEVFVPHLLMYLAIADAWILQGAVPQQCNGWGNNPSFDFYFKLARFEEWKETGRLWFGDTFQDSFNKSVYYDTPAKYQRLLDRIVIRRTPMRTLKEVEKQYGTKWDE